MFFKTPSLVVIFIISTFIVALTGHSAVAQDAQKAKPASAQLPASVYGALPEYQLPVLSPSGTKVAFIKNVTTPEHRSLLATFDFKTGKQTVLFASDNETVRFKWFKWANEDTMLVSLRFLTRRGSSRYEQTRMMSLKFDEPNQDPVWLLEKQRRRDPNPLNNRPSQFGDRVIDMLPSDPEHVIVMLDRDVPNMPSVYRLNIKTAKTQRIEMAKHDIREWTTDRQGNLRVGEALDYETGRSTIYERKTEDDSWRELYTFNDYEDASKGVYVSGFARDPNILYVRKYKGYHLALYSVNLTTKEETLVYADDTTDVDGTLVYSALTNDIIGVNHINARQGVYFFDPKHYELHDALDAAVPGVDSYLYGLSVDERKYLMYAESSNTPGRFYIGDRDKGSLSYLFGAYAKIDPQTLSKSQRIEYTTRDKSTIEAYISLPKTGEAPYPLIVYPPTGTNNRAGDGFDYLNAFFLSRGYAVIRPNVRGSRGLGLEFSNAQMDSWAGTMQTDLEDATQWMIEQGYADSDKMCVIGKRFGGYAATMITAKNPKLYQCAVTFAAVTDLLTYTRRLRNDFAVGELVVNENIGSSTSELKKRSPLFLVQDLEKTDAVDTLVVHGEYDSIVHVEQSRTYSQGLKSLDMPVTYLELKDGDHHLLNSKNRTAYLEAMDAFLARHLK